MGRVFLSLSSRIPYAGGVAQELVKTCFSGIKGVAVEIGCRRALSFPNPLTTRGLPILLPHVPLSGIL
jgi:hypothetical protein